MLGPFRAMVVARFGKIVQRLHGGQQCPALAVLQTQVAFASGNGRFEGEPRLDGIAVFAGLAVKLPLGGLGIGQRGIEHCLDFLLAFAGF